MKKPSKLRRLALVLAVFIIISFSGLAFYYIFIVIKIEEISMDLTVGSKVGFNTDRDALHFGTIYPGGESKRELKIENKNDFPILVRIENTGEFSAWVFTEHNDFVMEPEAAASIWYTASPPPDASYDTYEGSSRLIFKRKII